MADLYFYTDSSCLTQLSHSAVSITGTTLTAAALISYPGTAPEGQELDYWMISGKLAGLSDTKAEVEKDVAGYIVSNKLRLYPVWRTKISFTPTSISNLPNGNIVAPQGASIRYGATYNTFNQTLTDFLTNKNYDIVITNQDTDETLPASQVTFTTGDTTITNADNVQDLGAALISNLKTLTTSDAAKLPKAGGTMTGNLTIDAANEIINNGTLQIKDTTKTGYTQIGASSIKMTDANNIGYYVMDYYEDKTSGKLSLRFMDKNNTAVNIIGVNDPTEDTGAANKRYVMSAIGSATADIKTYIDTAIAEKIADAIGGAY